MNNSILTRRDNLYERMIKLLSDIYNFTAGGDGDEIAAILQEAAEIGILMNHKEG